MTTLDRKRAFTVPQAVFNDPDAVVRCRELCKSDAGSRLTAVTNAMIVLGEGSPP